MQLLLIRIWRALPLLVALGVLAAAVYVVVSWLHSPNKAKDVLIKLFTVLCGAIAGFFALASAYAAFESNWVAVEIAVTFMAVGLVGLGVTWLCRRRFRRNHPCYGAEMGPLEPQVQPEAEPTRMPFGNPRVQRVVVEVLKGLIRGLRG